MHHLVSTHNTQEGNQHLAVKKKGGKCYITVRTRPFHDKHGILAQKLSQLTGKGAIENNINDDDWQLKNLSEPINDAYKEAATNNSPNNFYAKLWESHCRHAANEVTRNIKKSFYRHITKEAIRKVKHPNKASYKIKDSKAEESLASRSETIALVLSQLKDDFFTDIQNAKGGKNNSEKIEAALKKATDKLEDAQKIQIANAAEFLFDPKYSKGEQSANNEEAFTLALDRVVSYIAVKALQKKGMTLDDMKFKVLKRDLESHYALRGNIDSPKEKAKKDVEKWQSGGEDGVLALQRELLEQQKINLGLSEKQYRKSLEHLNDRLRREDSRQNKDIYFGFEINKNCRSPEFHFLPGEIDEKDYQANLKILADFASSSRVGQESVVPPLPITNWPSFSSKEKRRSSLYIFNTPRLEDEKSESSLYIFNTARLDMPGFAEKDGKASASISRTNSQKSLLGYDEDSNHSSQGSTKSRRTTPSNAVVHRNNASIKVPIRHNVDGSPEDSSDENAAKPKSKLQADPLNSKSAFASLPEVNENDNPAEWDFEEVRNSDRPNRCYGKIMVGNGNEVPIYLITSNNPQDILKAGKGIFIVPDLDAFTVEECSVIYAGKQTPEIGTGGMAAWVQKQGGKKFCNYVKTYLESQLQVKKGKVKFLEVGSSTYVPIGKDQDKGGIKSKSLLFAVAPDCRDPGQNQNKKQLLTNAFTNSYAEAHRHSVKRVCTTALGTGVFAYPKEEGAQIMWSTALRQMADSKFDAIIVSAYDNKTDVDHPIKTTIHKEAVNAIKKTRRTLST